MRVSDDKRGKKGAGGGWRAVLKVSVDDLHAPSSKPLGRKK